MMVMVTNNTGAKVRALFDQHPKRIGHLMSPGGWRTPWGEYALDNGAFGAWRGQRQWDEVAYHGLCEKAQRHGHPPRWIVVPDVVANREATLKRWVEWAPRLRGFGWPLAIAVQDGMVAADIPPDADVLFVGGSTKWKWVSLPMWCGTGLRVHVGRVNSPRALWRCHDLGVESVDGTGWVRGCRKQWQGLVDYLRGDREACFGIGSLFHTSH